HGVQHQFLQNARIIPNRWCEPSPPISLGAPCQGTAGQCRWKHSQAPLWPWMTVRTKEKESEAERRQTQWSYSAGPYGPGRASKSGGGTSTVFPRRFSPGGRVVVLGSASGLASWDVACPSSGLYPPPACP